MKNKIFSAQALLAAQNHFELRFPPDVFHLLSTSGLHEGYDWEGDYERISDMLAWPLEGLLYDVEENGLWWPEWGVRPDDVADRTTIVTKVVEAAPRLIPLFHHRFIPETPNESGNPIFSVMQSDIIIYGQNLPDWLYQEFKIGTERPGPEREIALWTQAVSRNGNPTYNPFRQDD